MNYIILLFSVTLFITYSSDVGGYNKRLIEQEVELLSKRLKSSNGAIRYSAVRRLSQINSRKAVKPLLYALNDQRPIIRRLSCIALAKLKYYKSVNPLIRLVKREKTYYVLKEGILALGQIGDERARFVIQRFLKSSNLSLRLSAKKALKMLDKGVMPY